MSISSPKTAEVAFNAINSYLMPELQRDLVWTLEHGVTLIDSLYRGFSVGSIQLWQLCTDEKIKLRSVSDKTATSGSLLIIDGQQRCTALAAICGVGSPDWVVSTTEQRRFNDLRSRVCVSVDTFEVGDVSPADQKQGSKWLSVHKLCTASEKDLPKLVAGVLPPGTSKKNVELASAKLQMFKAKILSHDIAVEARSLSLGEAVEAFDRLNSRGVRLSQGDLIVAAFALRSPGFSSDQLKPYVEKLVETDLAYGNNARVKIQDAVLRSVMSHLQVVARRPTAKRSAGVRLKTIDFDSLPMEKIGDHWPKIRAAWDKTLAYFTDRGVDPSTIRGLNELAPLVMLTLKFPEFASVEDDRMALAWLYMRRADRYAKQSTDAHAADVDLLNCRTLDEALSMLVQRTAEERLRKFNADVPRFSVGELLGKKSGASIATGIYGHAYVLMLGSEGRVDPINGSRLAYTKGGKGRAKGAGHDAEWHHVVPRNLVSQLAGKSPEWVDSMANMSFVSSETNKQWKDVAPSVYLRQVEPGRLTAQGFDLAVTVSDLAAAEDFVRDRASWLSIRLNGLLAAAEALANGLVPAPPSWGVAELDSDDSLRSVA